MATEMDDSLQSISETWLKDAVLSLFPDTRDCSPSLANFFNGEKRWNRQNKRAPQAMSNMRHRPLAPALAFDQKDEEPVSRADSSRHLGLAAKQLAPINLQSPLIDVKSNAGTGSTPSIQLKRSLGAWRSEEWKFWLGPTEVFGKIIFVTALGSILFALVKLTNMQFRKMGNGSKWGIYKPRIEASSPTWSAVLQADIFKDGIGNEMAEIEVLLEEAAELVDESRPKNPTYYR
ncbi:Plastid division protein CDP1 [Abeliophyllum distichum]|uniref:Plastid division protein CDP1 n=1 Tax=Abeliophyllum distichum TaxID=126358 RepID=A0ABD1RE64_9LAMI